MAKIESAKQAVDPNTEDDDISISTDNAIVARQKKICGTISVFICSSMFFKLTDFLDLYRKATATVNTSFMWNQYLDYVKTLYEETDPQITNGKTKVPVVLK